MLLTATLDNLHEELERQLGDYYQVGVRGCGGWEQGVGRLCDQLHMETRGNVPGAGGGREVCLQQ